jgi:superfamily II DNA or RNA helicase
MGAVENNAAPDSSRFTGFTPVIRLYAETVVVSRREGLGCTDEEVTVPFIDLTFDYGGMVVRASEPIPRSDGTSQTMFRDRSGENRARAVIERLGAVDLACVEDISPPPDCEADYVVRVDGDAHAYCAFTSQALPKLRAAGFRVDIDARYPFCVVEADDTSWYAAIERFDDLPDWFSLELGIEVGGQKVDLLPLVVDLIEKAREGGEGLSGLERGLHSSYAMPVSDTHHVTLTRDKLRTLLQVMVELYQGARPKQGKFAFPEMRAPALARLDEVFTKEGTKIEWRDPDDLTERAFAVTNRPKTVTPPPELRATLRSYQEEGVAFLQHLRACGVGGVLADDMGLGKTLQTIAHLCIEKSEGRLGGPEGYPALIVAPTSLLGNWSREIGRFAPHLKVTMLSGGSRHERWKEVPKSDVVITTYGLLVRDEETFSKQHFHIMVLDEAQAIKNTTSLANRSFKVMSADHRLCLTGTPVENHIGELWSIFDFLNPGLLGDELSFRRFYRHPIEQLKDEDRLKALREQVAPYILRRMKREAARELPQKNEILLRIDLAGAQRDLYENIRVAAHADVRKVIKQKGLAASALPIFGALLRLRQVCCDPRLVQMDTARTVRTSAKYDAFFELLERKLRGGHRVLVFSQFTSMLALLAEGLAEREVEHITLTGATANRQAKVDAFEQGLADVFLISLKAGGTGLNLVSADTVIHYDPWWNPAVQLQATDRAYRIGQQRPVSVYNLAVAGSVEERVMRMQDRKKWMSSTLLGDEQQSAAGLSETDVETLFAPLGSASA